jgi:hypothetical protein
MNIHLAEVEADERKGMKRASGLGSGSKYWPIRREAQENGAKGNTRYERQGK